MEVLGCGWGACLLLQYKHCCKGYVVEVHRVGHWVLTVSGKGFLCPAFPRKGINVCVVIANIILLSATSSVT